MATATACVKLMQLNLARRIQIGLYAWRNDRIESQRCRDGGLAAPLPPSDASSLSFDQFDRIGRQFEIEACSSRSKQPLAGLDHITHDLHIQPIINGDLSSRDSKSARLRSCRIAQPSGLNGVQRVVKTVAGSSQTLSSQRTEPPRFPFAMTGSIRAYCFAEISAFATPPDYVANRAQEGSRPHSSADATEHTRCAALRCWQLERLQRLFEIRPLTSPRIVSVSRIAAVSMVMLFISPHLKFPTCMICSRRVPSRTSLVQRELL